MAPRTKSSLIAMVAAILVLVAAVVWGVLFAFPEPDASPEEATQLQAHARTAGWVMLGAISLFLVALGRLLWYLSRAR
jgi:hypothetical protein